MKVAFILRPDAFSNPGGDTVQALRTKEELELLGVQVEFGDPAANLDYKKFDLLHLFNMIDCEDLLRHAMKTTVPYVLSTIYVDYREYDRKERGGMIGLLSRILPYDSVEYIKTLGKWLIKGEKLSTPLYLLKGHRGSVQYLLRHSSCLLPNSENEYRRVTRDYGIRAKYLLVPNGVDCSFFKEKASVEKDIILSVGRIEGRKNQLNLIKAMNGSNLKTVIIGPVSENQKAYYRACREAADENVSFIDRLQQEQLLEYYARARVHVLPSWFETTGLSSLEAAVMGANLVVGDRGDVRDYFDDMVEYCDPGNVDSIKKAVFSAWEKAADSLLKSHICENFSWKKAADATFRAYKAVLSPEKL